jgi:uncharacterized membrane protein
VPDSHSPGLSDNDAAALSYITFVPAMVFLSIPPYNASSYIRFHAWQSIFLNAAAFVLWVGMFVVMVIGLFFVPLLAHPVRHLILLVLFVAWLICMLQALNGKRYKLPIIGAIAERLANK